MKICEICNHENNDRSCFCEKCGAQFPVDSKTREEIFCIVKNANLGISNKPIFYPDLDKKIKEKLLKHFDLGYSFCILLAYSIIDMVFPFPCLPSNITRP